MRITNYQRLTPPSQRKKQQKKFFQFYKKKNSVVCLEDFSKKVSFFKAISKCFYTMNFFQFGKRNDLSEKKITFRALPYGNIAPQKLEDFESFIFKNSRNRKLYGKIVQKYARFKTEKTLGVLSYCIEQKLFSSKTIKEMLIGYEDRLEKILTNPIFFRLIKKNKSAFFILDRMQNKFFNRCLNETSYEKLFADFSNPEYKKQVIDKQRRIPFSEMENARLTAKLHRFVNSYVFDGFEYNDDWKEPWSIKVISNPRFYFIRRSQQNSYLLQTGKQEDSILFLDGRRILAESCSETESDFDKFYQWQELKFLDTNGRHIGTEIWQASPYKKINDITFINENSGEEKIVSKTVKLPDGTIQTTVDLGKTQVKYIEQKGHLYTSEFAHENYVVKSSHKITSRNNTETKVFVNDGVKNTEKTLEAFFDIDDSFFGTINVTDNNGNVKVIDLYKLFATVKGREKRNMLLQLLKRTPNDLLLHLHKLNELNFIKSNVSAYYPLTEKIVLSRNSLDVLFHEVGHFLIDSCHIINPNERILEDVRKKGFADFRDVEPIIKKDVGYYTSSIHEANKTHSPIESANAEMISDSICLLKTPPTFRMAARAHYLLKYFPEYIVEISKKLTPFD